VSELSKLGYERGNSVLPFKHLIRKSQEYLDFFGFSGGGRRQGVEVFEKTSSRKTGGAKVPFYNFDAENYLGDAGLRDPTPRFASPVTRVEGVENGLRGDFDPGLKRSHSTRASVGRNEKEKFVQ
jgi:hypothetical protein